MPSAGGVHLSQRLLGASDRPASLEFAQRFSQPTPVVPTSQSFSLGFQPVRIVSLSRAFVLSEISKGWPSPFKVDPRDHLPLEEWALYKKPEPVRTGTFKILKDRAL